MLAARLVLPAGSLMPPALMLQMTFPCVEAGTLTVYDEWYPLAGEIEMAPIVALEDVQLTPEGSSSELSERLAENATGLVVVGVPPTRLKAAIVGRTLSVR